MKIGWVVGLLLTATVGFGQYGPDVVVPRTSQRVREEKPGTVHTNHLVYIGPWRQQRSLRDYPDLLASLAPVQSIAGYHPADIRAAYNLPENGGNQAIAVIDAYHYPTALNDFNVFSQQFGLPTETSGDATASTNTVFEVIYASGTKPPTNADWASESALDMEWSHAVAPRAKIYLIECATDSMNDMMAGVRVANSLPDVRQISMSFGSSEFQTETQFDANFGGTNKVYFGSVGDASNQVSFPAVSTKVIGVGGTRLTFTNGVASETAWTSSGGGVSIYIPRPSYQDKVSGVVGGFRGTPDLAADADPQTGVAVYDSTPVTGVGSGWLVFGGTSLSAPLCAGVVNLRGFYPSSSISELNREYGMLGTPSLRDVTQGTSGRHSAMVGYDLVTGVGTPLGIFPDVTANAAAVSITAGAAVKGTPGNVTLKDNQDLVLRSVNVGGTWKAEINGNLSPALPGGSVLYGSTISVTGFATGGTSTVSVQNPSNGTWVSVGTLNFTSTNGARTLTLTSPATYVNSSGTLKFRITRTGSTSFYVGYDQVKLTATPN